MLCRMISRVVRKSHIVLFHLVCVCVWVRVCACALRRGVCDASQFLQSNQNQLCDLFNFILLLDTLPQLFERYLYHFVSVAVRARNIDEITTESRCTQGSALSGEYALGDYRFVVFRFGVFRNFSSSSLYIWCALILLQLYIGDFVVRTTTVSPAANRWFEQKLKTICYLCYSWNS